jgi:hypothetical protein
MAEPNPNGANGTTSDPREQIMWDYYVDGIRQNKTNAYEAAIKAGYSKSHSENITLQGWFKEKLEDLERKDMLSKAEKKLAKTLTYEVETQEGKIQTDLLRIQTDVAKHLTSTLGKNKGYSTKIEQEHSGNIEVINLSEEEKAGLKKLLNK